MGSIVSIGAEVVLTSPLVAVPVLPAVVRVGEPAVARGVAVEGVTAVGGGGLRGPLGGGGARHLVRAGARAAVNAVSVLTPARNENVQ